MLLERGIDVSYETVRRWTRKFGPQIARNLRRRQAHPGDVWHLDEVVVKIAGRSFWLWRAVESGRCYSGRDSPNQTRQTRGKAASGGTDQAIQLRSETYRHR